MWSLGKEERLVCPPEFQRILTSTFGVNVYGAPLYRIMWGQCDTTRVSNPYGGYEDYIMGGEPAAWLVQRWTPAEKWGTPEIFDIVCRDPVADQPLFEYPEYGKYETIFTLTIKELKDGVLRVTPFPLDYSIIDEIIPFIDEAVQLSVAEQKAIVDRDKALKERAEIETITDRLMDALPTRYGPTSYGRPGCLTSVLDRKMHEIQQVWNRHARTKLRPVGMSQG